MVKYVFGLIVVHFLLWNIFVPVFEPGEEANYYQHVYYFASGGTMLDYRNFLPENVGVMGYPPTFYLPLVPIVWLFESPSVYDAASAPVGSLGTGRFRHDFFNLYQHPERELLLRWNKQEQAVHMMRLVANISGLVVVALVYASGLIVFGKDRILALAAAAFVGLNPMFAHIHASIVVNTLLILVASVMVYFKLRWEKMNWWQYVVLGSLGGLAMVTKITGFTLVPIFLLSFWLFEKKSSLVYMARTGCWFGLGFMMSAGWWFWRNWRLYGDILAVNITIKALQVDTPAIIRHYGWINYWWGFFSSYFTTFWTGYGWSAVYFPKWIGWVILAVMIVAGLGAINLVRSAKKIMCRRQLVFFMASLGIWLSALLMAHSKFPTQKAKDLYPMIVPISILSIAGWQHMANKWGVKISRQGLMLATTVWFVVDVTYLFLDVVPKLANF